MISFLTLVAPAYYIIPGFVFIGFVVPYCIMLYFEKNKHNQDSNDEANH